jgi:hypothetical protein
VRALVARWTKGGRLTAQFYTRGSLSWNPNSRVMGWHYTLRPDGNRAAVSPYTAGISCQAK